MSLNSRALFISAEFTKIFAEFIPAGLFLLFNYFLSFAFAFADARNNEFN